MEIDCRHWPIFYDMDEQKEYFIDPRAETQMDNWMASVGGLPSKYYQTPWSAS